VIERRARGAGLTGSVGEASTIWARGKIAKAEWIQIVIQQARKEPGSGRDTDHGRCLFPVVVYYFAEKGGEVGLLCEEFGSRSGAALEW